MLILTCSHRSVRIVTMLPLANALLYSDAR
jgi:hypothetical protein